MKENKYIPSKYIKWGILITTTIILFFHAKFLSHYNILFNHNTFSYPSYIVLDQQENRYILDQSTTKILVLDKNNQYKFQIDGGSTAKKAFNFANNIMVDELGNIYISDVESNDNDDMDQAFKILKYNANGVFEKVLVSVVYPEDEELYIHSSCLSLEYYNGRLYYTQREKEQIALYSIAVNGLEKKPKLEAGFAYNQAGLLVADTAINPKTKELYFSDKKGDIYKAGETIQLIYDGGSYLEEIDFFEIPFDIVLSEDGRRLYYTDLGRREIICIDLDSYEKKTVYHRREGPLDEQPLIYRLSFMYGTKDKIAFCSSEENSFTIVSEEQNILKEYNQFTYSSAIRIRYFILLILLLLWILYILKQIWKQMAAILIKKNSEMFQTCSMVLISMILVFGITASYIIQDTSERYMNNVLQNMYSMARLTASMVDGDSLEKLESPDDYMNEDYISVRNQLHEAFDKAYGTIYDFGDNSANTTYCVFYRMRNNVVYYTMHLSDDTGVVYPDILTYEESDYKYIRDNNTAIIFSEISTDNGEWMYASVPVYNSKQEMIAVCEVGRDRLSYDQANTQMVLELVIKIGCLAVVIFFVIAEVVNLIQVLKRRFQISKETKDKNEILIIDFVRIFAFLLFMADNFTSVIIPIMSGQLVDPSLKIPAEIATALPTSAQSFAAAITGFLLSKYMEKIGNKKSFQFGIFLHIIGLTLCGMANSLFTFTMAMFVVGVGMGVNVICLNTYVAERTANEQVKGFAMITTGTFAGTNCGIIIGTMISEEASYSAVFFLSAIAAFFLMIVVSMLYKQDYQKRELDREKNKIKEKKIGVWRFILNKQVLGYFLFAMAPYLIFASFVYYFLPIFAADNGVIESNIGMVTLIYGMSTAYLAPVSVKIIERFGSKLSIIIASVLTIAALSIFIVSPSIATMFIVVFIMGIADSFGYTALSSYFISIKEVEEYGESNALSINSIFDGMANTIAPYIFAVAMMIGIRKGMLIIGGIFGILVILFFIISRRENIDEGKN